MNVNNVALNSAGIAMYPESKVLLFLGAGSSIYSGLSGVIALVKDFTDWLKTDASGKTHYLELVEKIITTIKQKEGDKIDIEMLLDAIEKIENRDKDFLGLFYDRDTFTLTNCNSYDLISDGKKLLSGAVKEFIKFYFTEKEIKTEYLDPLLKFLKVCRPLDIFSTNYDVCIELLCERKKKKCVTGFNPTWNPQVFETERRINRDIVRLYKIHGSATWYKTHSGEYESSNLRIKGTKFKLVTRGTAVPFIIYPGKKLQYDEPTFNILAEFRKQLKDAKYVFVIGYSFKDEHITKIFQNAARKEDGFVIFLISPSAHSIYNSTLKYHIDDEFREPSSEITSSTSDLEGRVIRLPYRLEKIVDLLKDKYLDNLIKAQQCEIERELDPLPDKRQADSRWYDCLLPYIECEYIDKVEKIIEEKIPWDELLMHRDYRLGCKIIIKSLLNVLPSESEKIKWLDRLKKYIPISPDNLEVKIENDKVHAFFRLIGQGLLYCDDTLNFYKVLLDIYKKHPIFCNDKELKSIENGEEVIIRACNYLDVWKKTTLPLKEYITIRKEKYEYEVKIIEELHKDANRSNELIEILCQIERKALAEYQTV
jgi:hypothetical protein